VRRPPGRRFFLGGRLYFSTSLRRYDIMLTAGGERAT
jgi:hypothetical protein